jgi:DNA helicase TIP49 (TBP-interacting protein)
LVAGYLGQTAIKTKKVIDECLDGVLFIDEAYALATGEKEDSFSKECVDTLCECLSDNRDNLMVIIAGYENEINNKLFTINQGLSSRFIWRFSTDKYSSNELRQIFVKKINENNWTITVDSAVLEKWFKENTKEFEYFGRDIEILFTYVKITHGKRVYGENKDSKKKLNIEDLNNGLSLLIKNKKQKEQQTTIFGLYT